MDTSATAPTPPRTGLGSRLWRWPFRLLGPAGRWGLRAVSTLRRMGAFMLITLGTMATKYGKASRVIRPLIQEQILRAGIKVLPIICFLGAAMGVVIVGQTVLLLMQVGQVQLMGPLLVTVVIRELAPLTAALVVLARVGTAVVTELGTSRAMGEVEALEALGVDPIHYLVIPRVVGFTVSIICLTVYLILFALLTGYLMGFLRGMNLSLGEFGGMIASAMSWVDFPLLGLKTLAFGLIASLIMCYHGLAEPMLLEQVGRATTRTVAHTVVACLLCDALFLPVYLLL